MGISIDGWGACLNLLRWSHIQIVSCGNVLFKSYFLRHTCQYPSHHCQFFQPSQLWYPSTSFDGRRYFLRKYKFCHTPMFSSSIGEGGVGWAYIRHEDELLIYFVHMRRWTSQNVPSVRLTRCQRKTSCTKSAVRCTRCCHESKMR